MHVLILTNMRFGTQIRERKEKKLKSEGARSLVSKATTSRSLLLFHLTVMYINWCNYFVHVLVDKHIVLTHPCCFYVVKIRTVVEGLV